jgi:hypothetical protein
MCDRIYLFLDYTVAPNEIQWCDVCPIPARSPFLLPVGRKGDNLDIIGRNVVG